LLAGTRFSSGGCPFGVAVDRVVAQLGDAERRLFVIERGFPELRGLSIVPGPEGSGGRTSPDI
jgi:hypothetical protein